MDRETVPWPKTSLGRWELRKAYMIQMSRLPAFAAGYCYSKRVIYIDTETFFPLYAETYDVTGCIAVAWLSPVVPIEDQTVAAQKLAGISALDRLLRAPIVTQDTEVRFAY